MFFEFAVAISQFRCLSQSFSVPVLLPGLSEPEAVDRGGNLRKIEGISAFCGLTGSGLYHDFRVAFFKCAAGVQGEAAAQSVDLFQCNLPQFIQSILSKVKMNL